MCMCMRAVNINQLNNVEISFAWGKKRAIGDQRIERKRIENKIYKISTQSYGIVNSVSLNGKLIDKSLPSASRVLLFVANQFC